MAFFYPTRRIYTPYETRKKPMSTCPQYETKEPKRGTSYYTPNPSGTISKWTWRGQAYDYARLNHYNVYLKESDAKDRVRWNVEMVCRSPSISLTPLLDRATELLDAQKNAGRVASELAAAALHQYDAQVAAANEKDCADDYADACMFAVITRPKEPSMSEYSQPEVVAPELGTTYFIADTVGNIITCKWLHEIRDLIRLEKRRVYLTEEAAKARCEWDLKDAERRTIPAFIRALGPKENIEYNYSYGGWGFYDIDNVIDWSTASPELFRTKPDWFTELGPEVEVRVGSGSWKKYIPSDYARNHDELRTQGVLFRTKREPVVKEINGVRFSWPATVRKGDPKGPRHRIDFDGYGAFTIATSASWCNEYGPYVHETREGALEHLRALTSMES